MPRKEVVDVDHPYYQTQLQYNREYYHRNKEKFRDRNLMRLYKMTRDDYNEMLQDQDNRCAACGLSFEGLTNYEVHVDHDHNCCPDTVSCGMCIRGILCRGCNRALGFLEDDINKVRGLLKYLEELGTCRTK